MDHPNRSTVLLLSVVATVLVVWGLRASQPVSLPLAFALVLLMFFRPLQSWLDARLPRWLGVVVVLLLCLAFLGFLGALVSYSAGQIADRLPEYAEEASAQLTDLERRLAERGFAVSLPGAGGASDAGTGGLASGLRERAAGLARGFGTALALTALTLTLLVFLLAEVYGFRDKLRGRSGGPSGHRVLEAFDRMAGKFQRYFLVQAFTSLLTGLLTWGWCALLGVDFAFAWGVVAFAFNFVPTVGSILAVVPPTLFALGFSGVAVALGVAAGLSVIQFVLGNLVDPALQGRAVDLAPVVVLLSVVFWGWLWGIGGAVIAVPLTIALVLVFEEFDATRPVARFLSEPQTA